MKSKRAYKFHVSWLMKPLASVAVLLCQKFLAEITMLFLKCYLPLVGELKSRSWEDSLGITTITRNNIYTQRGWGFVQCILTCKIACHRILWILIFYRSWSNLKSQQMQSCHLWIKKAVCCRYTKTTWMSQRSLSLHNYLIHIYILPYPYYLIHIRILAIAEKGLQG